MLCLQLVHRRAYLETSVAFSAGIVTFLLTLDTATSSSWLQVASLQGLQDSLHFQQQAGKVATSIRNVAKRNPFFMIIPFLNTNNR